MHLHVVCLNWGQTPLGNLRKPCCADLLRILLQFEAKKRRRSSATARLFGKEVRQKARQRCVTGVSGGCL